MRQTAGTLNRTWLTILGVIVLVAGIAALLQASGELHNLAGTAPSADPIVTGGQQTVTAPQWVVVAILIAGIIIGLLGLLWMLAQIPRRNAADTYRLHDDGGQGFTVCDPSVLARAVENQVNTLPGVVTSSALLRGTATEPDLTLQVTVNDRADVQELIHRIRTSTLPDLSNALETPLEKSRLRIDVSARAQSTGTVVHSSGTVLQ